MDPPYQLNLQDNLIRLCFEKKVLAEDGVLILEHLTNITWDHFPWWTETRTYGGSSFSFFQWKNQDEEE
jgi:16S rRNA G966 N2-methylase RsmD